MWKEKREEEEKRKREKRKRRGKLRRSLTYRASTDSETENGAGNNQSVIGTPRNMANSSGPEAQCDGNDLENNEGDCDTVGGIPDVLFEVARRK